MRESMTLNYFHRPTIVKNASLSRHNNTETYLLAVGSNCVRAYFLEESLKPIWTRDLTSRCLCTLQLPTSSLPSQMDETHHNIGCKKQYIMVITSDSTAELHELTFSPVTNNKDFSDQHSAHAVHQHWIPVASIQLDKALPSLPHTSPRPSPRLDGVTCSSFLSFKTEGVTMFITAASYYHDYLHVLKVGLPQQEGDPSRQAGGSNNCMSAMIIHLGAAGLSGVTPCVPSFAMDMYPSVHVRAVELLPGPSYLSTWESSTCFVALLYQVQSAGSPDSVFYLDCMELDWKQGSLRQGPWSLRNVHPTTSLLLPLTPVDVPTISSMSSARGTHAMQPGLLVFSSRTLIFISNPDASTQTTASNLASMYSNSTDPASAAISAAAAVQASSQVTKQKLLDWELPGVPTCVEWLSPGLLLVGDTMAGLHLVRLGPNAASCWMTHIIVPGPLSVPSVLKYLPSVPATAKPSADGDDDEQQQQDGILFLGSSLGNSQLLRVPFGVISGAQEGPLLSHMRKVWSLQEPAFIKSLAPVQDAVMVPDSQGAEDPSMLICCGRAPCGRLAAAKLALPLKPYLSDGPEVPAGVRLFPLRTDPSAPGHTHLAFSFDAASRTDILDLRGDSFTQSSLTGVDSGRPSLLVTTLSDEDVLQVSSTEVRCTPRADPAARTGVQVWHISTSTAAAAAGVAPCLISMAASCGRWVVLMAGSNHLFVLHVETGSCEFKVHYEGQVSNSQLTALSLLWIPSQVIVTSGLRAVWEEKAEELYVAVGEWCESQRLLLMRLSDLLEVQGRSYDASSNRSKSSTTGTKPVVPVALCLEIPGETPRSAAVLLLPLVSVGSTVAETAAPTKIDVSPVLLVGTNGGKVLVWEMSALPEPLTAGVVLKGEEGCSRFGLRVKKPLEVCISNVAVELMEWQSGDSPVYSPSVVGGIIFGAIPQSAVYVHSGSDAIIRLRYPTTPQFPEHGLVRNEGPTAAGGTHLQMSGSDRALQELPLSQRLEVCRLHGSVGLRAVCPVMTDTMPSGSMAWVNREGRLLFGRVQPGAQQLCWTTAYIGDTPHHACYHAASHCHVILTQDASGDSWLRLVHADTLNQVLAFKLATGHHYTSLSVQRLPCSSLGYSAGPTRLLPSSVTSSNMPTTGTPVLRTQIPSASAATTTAAHQQQRKQQGASSSSSSNPSLSHASSSKHATFSAAAMAMVGNLDEQAGHRMLLNKEFVVLSSYLMYDSRLDSKIAPGLKKTQGLLSFFEITLDIVEQLTPSASSQRVTPPPTAFDATSSHSGSMARYGLLLHGTCHLPSVCMSVCTAVPEWNHKSQQPDSNLKKDLSDVEQDLFNLQVPLLIAGCQNGVHAFSVHVDDLNMEGSKIVNVLAQAVSHVRMLPFPIPHPPQSLRPRTKDDEASGDGGTEEERQEALLEIYNRARRLGSHDAGGGREEEDICNEEDVLAAAKAHLEKDWNQHVSLILAGSCEALSQAVVTQVEARGSAVFATEFLGSITVMRLVSNEGGTGLVPTAVDRRPTFAQCMLPLSSREVLIAQHPNGLTLLGRDLEQEDAFVEEARSRFITNQERGMHPSNQQGGGPNPAGRSLVTTRHYNNAGSQQQAIAAKASYTQLLGITAQDCPDMPMLMTDSLACKNRSDENHHGFRLSPPQSSVYKMLKGQVGLHLRLSTCTAEGHAYSSLDTTIGKNDDAPVTTTLTGMPASTQAAGATLLESQSDVETDGRGGNKEAVGAGKRLGHVVSLSSDAKGVDANKKMMGLIALGSDGSVFSL